MTAEGDLGLLSSKSPCVSLDDNPGSLALAVHGHSSENECLSLQALRTAKERRKQYDSASPGNIDRE